MVKKVKQTDTKSVWRKTEMYFRNIKKKKCKIH